MTYTVKEIFYTIQGEGLNSGRPAIFCRFSGCNLWNGKEKHKNLAICNFCDTDFVGGVKYKASENLVEKIKDQVPLKIRGMRNMLVVLTGGEPALQIDKELINGLKKEGFEIAIETNGTIDLPKGIDWICVSPKGKSDLVIRKGNELKFVFPQENLNPINFIDLEFDYFLLQPMDVPWPNENVNKSIDYCMKNPLWRLSLQNHKTINIR
jgi:7-carboxy-7-deazaguanine synthase (Cx14CxxC type)